MSHPWLQKLKLVNLRHLAISIGSPCSGTKSALIEGIQDATNNAKALAKKLRNEQLKIISIDMGVKNLAYTSIRSQSSGSKVSGHPLLRVEAWQRYNIADEFNDIDAEEAEAALLSKDQTLPTKGAEPFAPRQYAIYAYKFIKKIVDTHQPSHVLIERQRFRSGSGAAVQEWSIRVGMFEAMLYATLRTLNEQKYCNVSVVPMSPAAVNRFWQMSHMKPLEEPQTGSIGTRKRKAAENVKKQKIRAVARLLRAESGGDFSLDFTQESNRIREDYLKKLNKDTPALKSVMPKLDDLADCMLQGLAWILWQKNRLTLANTNENSDHLYSSGEAIEGPVLDRKAVTSPLSTARGRTSKKVISVND